MTNDIEAAIDTAYGAAFGVGPMPTGSRGWFALGYRAALAHATRGEPVRCWRDAEGTLPARRDGDKVVRVDDVVPAFLDPTPPPATGEAGTRGERDRREEIVREVIAGAKVLSATLRSLATMGPKHLAALQLEAALINYDAMFAATARALPEARDASNPGEKEER